MLSEPDRERIAEAIAKAERNTSGEIVAIVAAASSSYLYVPFLWAGILALLVPWPLIFFTWMPVQLIYALQLAVYLVVVLLLLYRPLRYLMVPAATKHARAHRRAVEQFLAQNLHTTAGRTGVLIFVSIAERFAEIIADRRISEKVPKEQWDKIVADLTGRIADGRPAEGFIEAIEAAGRLLAEHFPPGSHNPDELPNHLIVLDSADVA
jgi:putative membrane protein